jgi:hypothetical protein
MIPEMAMDLYKYGFTTKQAVYDWLWKQSFIPMKQYRQYGWYDFTTSGGISKEASSGKAYKDLPDDYMLPALGTTAASNKIIVAGGQEEICLEMGGGRSVYPIDPWR